MTTATNNQSNAGTKNNSREGTTMVGNIVSKTSKVIQGVVASAVLAGGLLIATPAIGRARSPTCPFDWTHDGVVTMTDVVFVLQKYGQTVDDELILINDVAQTLLHYGDECS